MEPPGIDPEHENKVRLIVAAAERQLGEDRFGGAWIDRTSPGRPLIRVAVVRPSQEDVDAIHAEGQAVGWPVEFVAVRYSRAELLRMLNSLDKAALPGDAWLSLGWDPRLNAIHAQLHRWDDEAAAWLYERLPQDAVAIIVRPGVRIVAAEGGHVAPR